MIVLTDAGIEEMKRSRPAPDQATEHFPPISVIHVEGDAIGSAIEVGSPRAHRAVAIGDLNLDNVREIVGEFEARAASLHLTDDDARQLRVDMAAVRVQTGSPTPDHYTIRGHLQSARAILEHATDGAATAACSSASEPAALRGRNVSSPRVDDRSRRTRVQVIVHATIDPAARPMDLHGPPAAAFTPGRRAACGFRNPLGTAARPSPRPPSTTRFKRGGCAAPTRAARA